MSSIPSRVLFLIVLLWCPSGCVAEASADTPAALSAHVAHCHDVTQWDAAHEFASCLCNDDPRGYRDAAACEVGIVGGFCVDEADCAAVIPQEMLGLYTSCRERACDDGVLAPCWALFQF